jgi:hypothetical protein
MDRAFTKHEASLKARLKKLQDLYDAGYNAANAEYHTHQMSAIKAGLPIAIATDVMNY